MGFEQVFIDTFGNAITDIILAIFLLVGVIIGILFRPRLGNMVLKLSESERTFTEFPIENESAVSIECSNVKGQFSHRFLKHAPGFVGATGRFVRRIRTIFLAKEGTAYTWVMKGAELVKTSLPTYLQVLWGKKFYDMIPDEQRNKLEEGKIEVTVELASGLTPEDYRPVSETDIKAEEKRKAAQTFWQGKDIAEKGATIKLIIAGLAGAGILGIISKLLGWW